MFTDPTFTAADQIFWIVDLFRKTLAAEACKRRIGVVSVAVWTRVGRFQRRFSALYGMWKAGTLPQARARAAATPHPTPPPQGGPQGGREAGLARAGGVSVLPRAFAWLYKILPVSAGTLASMLGPLLSSHPEMKAFVAEVPQAGRMLRPICTMVGLKPPEWLALPQRKRVRTKDTATGLSEGDAEAPRRLTARIPETPPARSAKRALARGFAGKPVDVTKLSAVAYGRSFGPLPEDYVPPKDWE
jgi:hypothetical protein